MISRCKDRATATVWARIGFEFARSTFDWRVDETRGPRSVPTELTTDLMEIDFFCEVAWLKLGKARLAPGPIDWNSGCRQDERCKGARLNGCCFALDAICVTSGRIPAQRKFRPGEDGRDASDREAAEPCFTSRVPARRCAAPQLALTGLWEICRDDEQQPGTGGRADSAASVQARSGGPSPFPATRTHCGPTLVFAHRVWYRTRVEVPATAAGRSFFLVFPQNNLNTTVYVNGISLRLRQEPVRPGADRCDQGRSSRGSTRSGSASAMPGTATRPSPNDPMKLRRKWNLPKKFFGDGFQDLAYPIWNHPESGILATPA